MAKPTRAPVGVAIIAKDAAKTLGACLASFRPYVQQVVVCVDQRTTDRTARVAKRGGAEVYPIKVSDWHECPQHDRVLVQHFANARMESFTHLNPDLDFWMWVDSDDVITGAEHLPALCAGLPPDCIGAWFQYEYSAIELNGQRQVNTVFGRERLLRTHLDGEPVGWTWEGRVHETVKPDRPGKWLSDYPAIKVAHQPGTHTTAASAMRNLLLLEIDYEEDPESSRTVFYLGNQHFAMGNWPEAIHWYETLCSGLGTNPYELWQAYLYMSYAYERLGDITSASQAALCAEDVVPYHGEPYFRRSDLAYLAGDFEKAIFLNERGCERGKPPFFVFTNPLDYTFNQLRLRGAALLEMGRITECRATWEKAASVLADESLVAALEDVKRRETNMNVAQSFVALADSLNGKALDVYQALPDDVKTYGRTREVVMPAILKGRVGLTPRIVFHCGGSWEPWYPGSINTTGIGGSETAVIEIARRFAADGWTVDVYNNADKYEGIHDGVGYWDVARSSWIEPCDVWVSWRQPLMATHPKAGKNVLWCHDLNYGADAQGGFDQEWDVIAGVSDWHAKMLGRYYGVEATSLPNGIDLGRFTDAPRKVPFRCVYASSADRGLVTLLGIWPQIVETEPDAELHVAYGWETIDRMIVSGQRPELARFKADVEKKISETPNVVWRGRVGQHDLAQLYGESVAWLYPTDFLEVSCISAMEAMAGGAVPIATACGAIGETIAGAGLLIPGPTTSRPYRATFERVAMGILGEMNNQLTYSQKGRERAKELTWTHAYERWLEVLGIGDGSRTRTYEAHRAPDLQSGAIAALPSRPEPGAESHRIDHPAQKVTA